jgi:hypothetical protein
LIARGGRVAQLAEQCPFKAWVDGSSPSALTISSGLEITQVLQLIPEPMFAISFGQRISAARSFDTVPATLSQILTHLQP